jgi:formate/nitrite transporter FocA (FNT family)
VRLGREEVAMSPQREQYYRILFLVAAVYDIVLGTIFTFFHTWAFEFLDIADTDPGSGYVPLIGAFLFVIGVAYYLIYRGDLVRNIDLIAVGTLYKLAYSAVAFWFWVVVDDVPHILFPALFGVVDLVMFILMLECWLTVRRLAATQDSTPV